MPAPQQSEISNKMLGQIMIEEEVEVCNVQDTVDDGGTREYSSGV
jgi:hypothetical protein